MPSPSTQSKPTPDNININITIAICSTHRVQPHYNPLAPIMTSSLPKPKQEPDSKSPISALQDPQSQSFHPDQISLPTFRALLSFYPQTVERVHRRKLTLKSKGKSTKGAKGSKANAGATRPRNADASVELELEPELEPDQAAQVEASMEKFVSLDSWRYEGMPAVIAGRRSAGAGAALSKEELVDVMEWKTTHGTFRPMLMGMIKSNPSSFVIDCTSAAISSLPTESAVESDKAFPQASMDALQRLRGVGAATASLILSMATAKSDVLDQHPFYSDEMFLWLVVKEYPDASPSSDPLPKLKPKPKPKADSKFKRKANGDLVLGYTLAEYKDLWRAALCLRKRLSEGVEGGLKISQNDVEKVAYVLRNIGVSGVYAWGCGEVGVDAAVGVESEVKEEIKEEAKGEKGATFGEEVATKRKREEAPDVGVVTRASRSRKKTA
ncbi:hypothetical protein N7466_002599 [Penicillium verhagenii]|uniref:uncharacterized protein n=1 Tax=Penicillium verhagenii TaxID=1562060 RepID=UPI002545849A|nr:uncharacterized protein N7466_002599 [Penicillium verhagenii]KAJ5939465.1 hypothetical protein N7466_002599 [Penicillium verhagenii]